MPTEPAPGFLRYSVSLVTQGNHRFYTLTLPSDVLARTSFVTARDEDPQVGFQRLLDPQRAKEIADYIDTGLGTIPTSVILSAQPGAELHVVGRGKTLEFRDTKKAFLILDGQHRVFGFSKAKKTLRVPVVIYNGLSRKDESRLFIDINTRQRPVPTELLLDIKKLAEYESDSERLMGTVFDLFHSTSGSPLAALLSPSTRTKSRISRVTFNAAFKPILTVFEASDADRIYDAVSSYLAAFVSAAHKHDGQKAITNPTVFRAAMLLFPDVGQQVRDRFAGKYTRQNFFAVLEPMFGNLPLNSLTKPGNSFKLLSERMNKALRTGYKL